MSYKELADAIDNVCEDGDQRDHIAAILRSLDAQRPTVDEVMAIAAEYGTFSKRYGFYQAHHYRSSVEVANNAGAKFAELRTVVEALAAPVAAQPQQAKPEPITEREIELLDSLIEVQLDHALRCDTIGNRKMAEKQKAWDMERVELLRKLKAAHGAKKQAKPLSDAEFAINMLEMMFTAYENGTPCYEDPDDAVGFIGYAVRLADDDFKNIGDFLNRVRPVQSGIKEQG